MFSKLFTLSACAALAAAAVVSIDVSSSSGALSFSPDTVSAGVGDEVVFNFRAGGHSVVQSQDPNAACQPKSNGFFSGFQGPPTTFAILVNNTEPIWYYCSTASHCRGGMVGVINPP
jgi:plastocyanin